MTLFIYSELIQIYVWIYLWHDAVYSHLSFIQGHWVGSPALRCNRLCLLSGYYCQFEWLWFSIWVAMILNLSGYDSQFEWLWFSIWVAIILLLIILIISICTVPSNNCWDPTIIGWEIIGWERFGWEIIIKFAVYMYILDGVWGGFGQQDRLNYRSLLQKSPIQERIFCTRDL